MSRPAVLIALGSLFAVSALGRGAMGLAAVLPGEGMAPQGPAAPGRRAPTVDEVPIEIARAGAAATPTTPGAPPPAGPVRHRRLAAIYAAMPPGRAAGLLGALPPDDAAAILDEMAPRTVGEIIGAMPEADALAIGLALND